MPVRLMIVMKSDHVPRIWCVTSRASVTMIAAKSPRVPTIDGVPREAASASLDPAAALATAKLRVGATSQASAFPPTVEETRTALKSFFAASQVKMETSSPWFAWPKVVVDRAPFGAWKALTVPLDSAPR